MKEMVEWQKTKEKPRQQSKVANNSKPVPSSPGGGGETEDDVTEGPVNRLPVLAVR
jgi:hypothetical protein